MNADTPQVDVTDEEIDRLVGDAEHDGPTMPDETPEAVESVEAAPVQAPEPVAPAAPPPEPLHEFTHNGRAIKAPLSQILKWSSQGYDYSQKMASFNKEREAITAMEGQYKPIDEWVRANPDKWDRLQAVIKAEESGAVDLPPAVAEKLHKLEQFVQETQKERDETKQRAADEALDREVQSFREKYKELDWTSVDPIDGRTREQKVYAHAAEHGLTTFKTAFFDLYHEDLVKSAETRARESFAKEKERNVKAGILPSKGAPASTKLSQAPQTKTKNYQDTESILKELGI